MNKSAFNFAAGVLVGIAGIAVWEVIRGTDGEAAVVDNTALELQGDATIELLEEISYKLERQNEYIAFLPVGDREGRSEEDRKDRDEEGRAERAEEGRRNPPETADRVIEKVIVPAREAAALVSKAPDTSWISVLDKDLSLALVLMGLTPYDRGVSPLLRGATVKIREAREKRDSDRQVIREKIKQGGMSKEDYSRLSRAYSDRYSKEKSIILEDFSAALERLVATSGSGSSR